MHADLINGGGVGGPSPWGYGSLGLEGQPEPVAQGTDDPRAASAKSSIAIGKGVYEGMVGKPSTIEVIPRDSLGDGKKCSG